MCVSGALTACIICFCLWFCVRVLYAVVWAPVWVLQVLSVSYPVCVSTDLVLWTCLCGYASCTSIFLRKFFTFKIRTSGQVRTCVPVSMAICMTEFRVRVSFVGESYSCDTLALSEQIVVGMKSWNLENHLNWTIHGLKRHSFLSHKIFAWNNVLFFVTCDFWVDVAGVESKTENMKDKVGMNCWDLFFWFSTKPHWEN